MRYQSKYAELSDCAISMHAPSPVFSARSSAARIPMAPNAGPAVMPMLAWSGMRQKPSSSTTGWIVPDHASYAMPWLGRFWYGPVAP